MKNHRAIDMTAYGGGPAETSWFAPLSSGRAPALMRRAVTARARTSAFALIKRVARDYIRRPYALDSIAPSIQFLSPAGMIEALQQNLPPFHRWIGFGGEVPAINWRAAMVVARLQRARNTRAGKISK